MSEEINNDDSAPGPGAIIRYAREQHGIGIDELADEMRISSSKLQDLEQNNFSSVGADTFVRGYLRSSAKLLKLNADDLLAEYQAYIGDGRTAAEQAAEAKPEDRNDGFANWPKLSVLIVLIIAAAIAVNMFVSDSADSSNSQVQQSAQVPLLNDGKTDPVSGAKKVDDAEVGDQSDLSQANSAGQARSSQQGENSPADDKAASLVKQSVDAKPVPSADDDAADALARKQSDNGSDFNLAFSFSDQCWLEVRDNSGKRLYSGIKDAGQSLSLNGRAPFQVRLGNATAVSLQVNGVDYEIKTRPGSKTLKLLVP